MEDHQNYFLLICLHTSAFQPLCHIDFVWILSGHAVAFHIDAPDKRFAYLPIKENRIGRAISRLPTPSVVQDRSKIWIPAINRYRNIREVQLLLGFEPHLSETIGVAAQAQNQTSWTGTVIIWPLTSTPCSPHFGSLAISLSHWVARWHASTPRCTPSSSLLTQRRNFTQMRSKSWQMCASLFPSNNFLSKVASIPRIYPKSYEKYALASKQQR